MHDSTFEYLKPSDAELERMQHIRSATKAYGEVLEAVLPDGPDKTYVLRSLRSLAMWANVTITRHPDGSPREIPPQS